MSTSNTLTTTAAESIDEEIVAYLDGELDADAEARVVRRLSDDAAYRARLGQLQQAWDLLDNLRASEADEDFVQSTVAMVAVQAEDEARTMRLQTVRRRNLAWAAAVAVVLASLAGGFAYIRYKLTEPDRKFVRDMPVIEHVDEYRYIDDIDFLKQLAREDLFPAEVDDGM
jgi:anti-sigma factor RsiW